MTCPAPDCPHCALNVLHDASKAREGLFAEEHLRQQLAQLIRLWNHYNEQQRRKLERIRTEQSLLTVGCPYCDRPAGQWCVTAKGNVYDDRYGTGTATFHADRKRALADLAPTADIIELRPGQEQDA